MNAELTLKFTTPEAVNNIPLLRTLGIRLKEIGELHAEMEVEVTEMHSNYMRGAHGGVTATLIDSVSFFPKPLLPSGRAATTTNLNVNYIKPARIGDRLTARSELVHLGRRSASLIVKVTNQKEELIAHGTATLMILQEPPV